MKRDGVKQMIRGLINTQTHSPLTEEEPSFDEFANFFDIEDNTSKKDELDEFLSSRITELSLLDMYPAIKEVFIKHNTPIPTSAPVERLFSQAALVLTCKCNSLSDELLEILILL